MTADVPLCLMFNVRLPFPHLQLSRLNMTVQETPAVGTVLNGQVWNRTVPQQPMKTTSVKTYLRS